MRIVGIVYFENIRYVNVIILIY